MCQAMRELMKDEIAEERLDAANRAADKAETETQVKNIKVIMKNLRYTAEQAMDALEIPPQKRSTYLSRL